MASLRLATGFPFVCQWTSLDEPVFHHTYSATGPIRA